MTGEGRGGGGWSAPGGLPRRPVAPAVNDVALVRRLGFAIAGQFLGSSRWDGMLLNIRSREMNVNSTITIPGRALHQTLSAYPQGTLAALGPHMLWALPEGDEHIPWVLDELNIRINERGELLISPATFTPPTTQTTPRVTPTPTGPATPPTPMPQANVPLRSRTEPPPPPAAEPRDLPRTRPEPPRSPPPADDETPLKSDTFFVLQQFTTSPGPPTMPPTAYRKPPHPAAGRGGKDVRHEYKMPLKPTEPTVDRTAGTVWSDRGVPAPPPPHGLVEPADKHARMGDLLSDARHGSPDAPPETPPPPEPPRPRFVPDMSMKKEIGPGYLSSLGILPPSEDLAEPTEPEED